MSTSAAPRVIVCAGGGGVGKTTTSAALALALARAGQTTLIVTIDPARRLAGAMGVPISDEVTRVPLAEAEGRLFALMPEPRGSMRTFIEQLFEEHTEARDRLFQNRLYHTFADAAAGIHELVSMNLLARAAERQRFDVVVVDTAPSRHAIDFVTYPRRLTALFGGKAAVWLSGLAQRASGGTESKRGGLLAWGQERLEAILGRVMGPQLLVDLTALFSDMGHVRERFVALTERANELLLGPRASYLLVAAPTAAARDDVLYLAKRLEKLGLAPHALVMNRADVAPAPFLHALAHAPHLPPSVAHAVAVLEEERGRRTSAANAMGEHFASKLPRAPRVRLPFVERAEPEAIVAALSHELAPHLATLAGA